MRGKQFPAQGGGHGAGNIPAYAGKTERELHARVASTEHPRVCGENPLSAAGSAAKRGTSPRMRGKRHHGRRCSHRRRNIPAYAGKTPMLLRIRHPYAEHPRVCGENISRSLGSGSHGGTSPRMRGKPHRLGLLCLWGRNIPAYAGKTG